MKNTEESARDVYAFLQLFLDEYKKYANSPFHISGESYGNVTCVSPFFTSCLSVFSFQLVTIFPQFHLKL